MKIKSRLRTLLTTLLACCSITALSAVLLTAVLVTSGDQASADPRLEQRLIELSSRLATLVSQKVRDLSDAEQQRLLTALQEARRIVNRGADDPDDRDDRPGDIYRDSVSLGPVSRRSGGEILVAELATPVELSSVTVSLETGGQRVRITDAVLITDRASENLRELRGVDLQRGDRRTVSQLQRVGRVRRIEIRAEAWGDGHQLRLEAESRDRGVEFVRRGRPDPRPPGPGPRPPDRNGRYYCTASCATSSGGFNIRYARGAWGNFEMEAQESARAAVRSAYTCTYGIATGPCDQEIRETTTCSASCATSSGGYNLNYSAIGTGQSVLASKQSAREAVGRAFTCTYGVADGTCSTGYRPTYCVAACANSSGRPNLTYSRGAQGDNDVAARHNAITEVKRAYSCTYGVAIDRCESR